MPATCWKYVNCVTSIPSAQTSQPRPQAPTVARLLPHHDAVPVAPTRDLCRNPVAPRARRLPEPRDLRDLPPAGPDLPAEAPGAGRRPLPVVLDDADVVLLGVEPHRAQRF